MGRGLVIAVCCCLAVWSGTLRADDIFERAVHKAIELGRAVKHELQAVTPTCQVPDNQPKNVLLSEEKKLKWIPGCEILAERGTRKWKNSPEPKEGKTACSVLTQDETQLNVCLSAIKQTITRIDPDKKRKIPPSLDRADVFNRLYSELNPVEQAFAGMIFTAQGEAGILSENLGSDVRQPIEELVAIMRVIKNRLHEKQTKFPCINELDIALQPTQFSMYNPTDPSWGRVMAMPSDREQACDAIRAYTRYPKSYFKPEPAASQMTHYYSATLDQPVYKTVRDKITGKKKKIKIRDNSIPEWAYFHVHHGKKQIRAGLRPEIPLEINGARLPQERESRHKFYKDIQWMFQFNGSSGKTEASCRQLKQAEGK